MSLELLSCLVTVIAVFVLWWLHYGDVFPYFLVTASLVALQSVVTWILPAGSHWNRYVWVPVEILLLISMVFSLLEAALKRIEAMNALPQFWFLFGAAIAPAGIVMYLRMNEAKLQDWYPQFWQHDRPWFFLWAAIMAFCCLWFGFMKGESSATAALWHLLIYAGFILAHLLIASPEDWNLWKISDSELRICKMIALGLWVLNARHLNRQIAQLGRGVSGTPRSDAWRGLPSPSR